MSGDFFYNYAYIIFPSLIGLIICAGLFLFIYSFIDEFLYNKRQRTNLFIEGKIIDIKTHHNFAGRFNNCTYAAIIQYNINGEEFKYESKFSSTSYPEIGGIVNLLCNPLNFNDVIEADLKTFLTFRILGSFFIFCSLFIIAIFICIYLQYDCKNLKELFYYLQNN